MVRSHAGRAFLSPSVLGGDGRRLYDAWDRRGSSQRHTHARSSKWGWAFHCSGRHNTPCVWEKTVDAPTGTNITVSKGIPHAWCNLSESPLRMLVLFMPGGLDELFRMAAKDGDLNIAALLDKFGTRMIGPTLFDNIYTIFSPRAWPCRPRSARRCYGIQDDSSEPDLAGTAVNGNCQVTWRLRGYLPGCRRSVSPIRFDK